MKGQRKATETNLNKEIARERDDRHPLPPAERRHQETPAGCGGRINLGEGNSHSRELGSDGLGIIMQLAGAGRNMTHILLLPLITQLGTAL